MKRPTALQYQDAVAFGLKPVSRKTPNPQYIRGVFLVLFASVLWGISGSAAQILFTHYHLNPAWLVQVRTLSSGVMLLLFAASRIGVGAVFSVWRDVLVALRLVVFAVFGLLGVQYTYFVAIAKSNAATATLLQYLAPVLVVLWVLIRTRSRIRLRHILSVVGAVVGTALLVTNGHISSLGISVGGLIWGLLSAVELAFCSVFPISLIRRHGALLNTGWSMTIGGVVMGFFHPVWHMQGHFTSKVWLLIAFVALFGTMLSFLMFSSSLKVIPSEDASLLSCAEPLASAVFAVLFLHLHLHVLAWGGAFCIIFAVIVLSLRRQDVTLH